MKKIILLAMTVGSMSAFAQIPTSGLIGHWSFTGNANDASTNSNTGTVNGATLGNDRFGNSNSAYYFDGTNDYIEIPNISAYQDVTISLCFWFKMTAPLRVTGASLDNYMSLISKASSTVGGSKFRQFEAKVTQLEADTTAPYSLFSSTSYNSNSNQNEVWDGDTTIVLNKWYFVTILINSDVLSLYINGVLVDSHDSNVTPFLNTSSIIIGRHFDLHDKRWLNGGFDDFRIYNRVISECEILNIYLENYPTEDLFPVEGGMLRPIDNTMASTSIAANESVLLIQMDATGTEEQTAGNTVRVYPNPAKDHVVFDFSNADMSKNYNVKIVNTLGATVYQSKVTSPLNDVNIENIGGAGTYFIYLMDGDKAVSEAKKLFIVK